ncbi:hypothetical protein AB6A40_008538 [Gnathostoma spinigerum]|uniref:RING-type E3 ubiquitin transferase n=1 Tax=Gnathostoma spinigerum TaxID=75299 RepID=A0ABD6EX40_9BILA
MEWLKYSKKEVCELCSHKYSFRPIYRNDMPKTLPLSEIVKGLFVNAGRVLRVWAVYSLVLVAWLGVVPLTACRIYRAVFSASLVGLLGLPSQLFSLENIFVDCLKGCFIVSIFLCTFISLLWLQEQIVHGGPHEWLNIDDAEGEGNVAAEDANQPEDVIDANNENIFPNANVVVPQVNDVGLVVDGEPNRLDEAGNEGNEGGVAQGGEGENWPGWERVGDELTWQRLLGLDGSFVFLQHVFWVIALNTLFTVLFAFFPYQLGHALMSFFGIASKISILQSLFAVLSGYIAICVCVRILHVFAKAFRLVPYWSTSNLLPRENSSDIWLCCVYEDL